jgi:protein mago nashi
MSTEQEQQQQQGGGGGNSSAPQLYFRYYCGHHGKFGHEFIELEVKPCGTLRYANNSRYRGSQPIRKQAKLSPPVVDELRRIVRQSGVMQTDDSNWPVPDRGGRQELEIVIDGQHISFATNKISTSPEIAETSDPEGLTKFVQLVQDAKLMLQTLIAMHHKLNAI